ncbi:hypothetical protein PUMCH_001817 [Australozyma saopauloensis]|uniref:Nuclear rim protein 1 n=1 Tax=Australozyma saopauloensis TaxID=291208 RepID=A0AAX4H818_9ASCO|nr:hypothetical protein PUMCH_001817 [[Candida] saopauloensis]
MARRRLIRKQPLWERITSYPFDLLLSINEARLSIDWDSYVPQSLPIGTAVCYFFMVLCKVSNHYQSSNNRRDNSVFKTDLLTYQLVMARAVHGNFGASDSSTANDFTGSFMPKRAASGNLLWVLNFLLGAIVMFSIINVVTVVYSVRSYSLLNLSTRLPKPKGSNVVKQNLAHGPQKGIFLGILAYFEEHLFYETELETEDSHLDPSPDQYIEKPIWVLKVWDPSPFSLYLSCSLSPVVLAAIWLISSSVSFWKIIVIVTLFNLSAFYVVHKFFQLVSDKQIVYQETFNEYNRKYVIPKTCVLQKNAIVDATCGPMALPEDIVHDDVVGHLQDENVFVTHDLNGRRHKTVRADILARANIENRSPSPSKRTDSFASGPLPRRYPADNSHMMYNDSLTPYVKIAQSTPYRKHNESYRNDTFSRGYDTFSKGYDSFSRQSSQMQSPLRSPTRFPYGTNLSFDQRTQLSPSRSSRQLSPQRSPSPSKRPWH